MTRVVLVHGSVSGGRATWSVQRRTLVDRVDLVVLERPGFPGGPPTDRIDFDQQAPWLAGLLLPGDHLVGHSYGGVVSLLAAPHRPDLGSLTLLEPPCTRVALDVPIVREFAEAGAAWWERGGDDPEAFLRGFLRTVGSDFDPPSPLPAELESAARALAAERGPWEADIPLAAVAATPYPKLVVSGAHHPAFEAVCDVLEATLPAERLVLPGYGHNPQRHPDFDEALLGFVARAEQARNGGG